MTFDQMIEVLQAAKEGKKIRWRSLNSVMKWSDPIEMADHRSFDFRLNEYQVFKEPRKFFTVEWPKIAQSAEPGSGKGAVFLAERFFTDIESAVSFSKENPGSKVYTFIESFDN